MFGIAVAAAAVASNAIIVLACLRAMRGQRREFARREDMLIDKLCHLVGKPWNEAPASAPAPAEEPTPPEYVYAPEHYGNVWG